MKSPVQELTRTPATKAVAVAAEKDKKTAASPVSSDCSVSGRVASDDSSNLGRFLEYTTPIVPAQYLPKTSVNGWRRRESDRHPFFLLNDLWDSFEEWSAYGVGVPLLLNGGDSVVQYYVPYLSGIQLYVDPSRIGARPSMRAGDDSDADSPRDSGSDESTNCRNIVQSLNGISLEDKSFVISSSSKSKIGINSSSSLAFEYLEHDLPFGREPLAEKISSLSSRFPGLRTYRSCDLLPLSWVSIAWYPIYRIPLGQTLQNLDACFLTFHLLSTPFEGSRNSSTVVGPSKMSLPTFGLASYKFKASMWGPDGEDAVRKEHQRVDTLLRAAEEWLRQLQVILPDFRFFASHNTLPSR
ncbi:PREDICTED: uncharacterized protein LOC104802595 [Tarenaya hassleriana]|uniref:uncharacterized protein LOC104802595 n=1 Tax=Tarenaya hassleriana TaxID=28532 RepID=UPI00053C9CC9|nr:PREDICTED: uncharacterized protein LOC104802595 [Tarenaya hassleriana]